MNNTDYKFGLIKYNSVNIGDEIQSIAAMRFLPQIDEMFFRERLSKYKPSKPTKLIMNAWWMWNPKYFLPSSNIKPLLISMHIRPSIRKNFLNKKNKDFLLKNGPVGCRDKNTEKFLLENNIPAYYSGCLTTTLQRNPKLKRSNYILTVDLPNYVQKEIEKRTNRPVYNISRMLSPAFSAEQHLEIAKLVLLLYHNAHCIVSSRFHVANPALAFETPFLFFNTIDKNEINSPRYEGVEKFFNIVQERDFFANKNIYDFENPPENPKEYLKIREELIKKCSEFTGYNNTESLLDEKIEPLAELLKLLAYRPKSNRKSAWFVRPRDLFIIFFKKVFLKKDRHDFNY